MSDSIQDGTDLLEKEFSVRMKRIEEKFLSSLPSRIHELSVAHNGNDWKTINELGHKVKGTSACLGLPDISELGQKIQRAAANESMETIGRCLAELTEIYRNWVKNNGQ